MLDRGAAHGADRRSGRAVSVFRMVHLLRSRALVLSHIAGALAGWGWVTMPGLLVGGFYDLSLAELLGPEQGATAVARTDEYVGSAIMGVPVLLGMVGLLLLTARPLAGWV